ncbi:ATP-binding protein, partial [Candidatus Peregrinibacteria bacterium]|nr:ATP-binding protein [Candidatus Peregrinibacteria bacterium]
PVDPEAPTVVAEIPKEADQTRAATFEQLPDQFKAGDHTPPLAKLLKDIHGPRKVERPREGACTYMLFNIETPQSAEEAARIQAEIALLSSLPDYHLNIYNRWLTIIGTAERASNALFATAESFRKAFPASTAILGYGTIEHTDSHNFKIHGFQKSKVLEEWKELPEGTFLTDALVEVMEDPNSRESSHCEIESAPYTTGIHTLNSYKAKVSTNIGGPDELIGEEPAHNVDELVSHFMDEDARLIFVKGQAGKGKSRVILEALAKYPVANVKCSLDAADVNLAGASLVTIADQLETALEEDELLKEGSGRLYTFCHLTRAEKIQFAQENAAILTNMCIDALRQITFSKGPKTLLVLEDLHFADRHSEQWIEKIVSEYINPSDPDAPAGGKVLMSERPEEMYQSEAQRRIVEKLGRHFGAESIEEMVKTVEVKGLDFSNEQNSYNFAFHILPKAMRNGKTLGRWHKEVGRAAGDSPFIMTHIMKGLLTDQKSNFVVKGNVIELSAEALESIGKIDPTKPDALNIHFHQRISKLQPGARRVLQSITLAGGKLSAKQIEAVIQSLVGGSTDSLIQIREALVEGAYIKEIGKAEEGENMWELQHEMLKPFVDGSIEPAERAAMSEFLFDMVSGDPNTHPDVKLSLLHGRVEHLPSSATESWTTYLRTLQESIKNAHDHNARSKVFAIARAILDKNHGIRAVKQSVEGLKNLPEEGDEAISPELAEIAVSALTEIAENGVWLGRFEEAEAATKALHDIELLHPELVPRARVVVFEFEAAYLQRKVGKMKEIYESRIQGKSEIPREVQIMSEIKLLYRSNKHAEVQSVYAENEAVFLAATARYEAQNNGRPNPEILEVKRLAKLRCPLTEISHAVESRKYGEAELRVDQDVSVQRAALTATQAGKIEELIALMEEFKAIKTAHPTILNPTAELSLLEQEAQMHGMLGGANCESEREHLAQAKRLMAECWRQADQIGSHDAAARTALFLGNFYATEAVQKDLASGQSTYNRALLKKALEIHTRECRISTNELDETNDSHPIRRIQVIRDVALLIESYREEMDLMPQITNDEERDLRLAAVRSQLEAPIKEGLASFLAINERSKDQKEAAQGFVMHEYPEYCYYTNGYFLPIFQMVRQLGIEMPQEFNDLSAVPFLSVDSTLKGISFGAEVTDLNLGGERSRKMRNLTDLLELIQSHRDIQLAQSAQ